MVLLFLYHYLIPFGNLNNQKFLGFINNNNNNNNDNDNNNNNNDNDNNNNININNKELEVSNSFLILKPPPDLARLFNQSSNAIPENNSVPENVIQSKYYEIDELQQLKIPN